MQELTTQMQEAATQCHASNAMVTFPSVISTPLPVLPDGDGTFGLVEPHLHESDRASP